MGHPVDFTSQLAALPFLMETGQPTHGSAFSRWVVGALTASSTSIGMLRGPGDWREQGALNPAPPPRQPGTRSLPLLRVSRDLGKRLSPSEFHLHRVWN